LRAIRFASRFDFQIDSSTWDAIVASAPHLTRLSAERVKQEIDKTMDQVLRPGSAFRMWRESGALRVLVPALADITDIELATIDEFRLPESTGNAARQSARKIGRITALFAAADGSKIGDTLKQLRFSNSEAKWIAATIAAWRQLAQELTMALLQPEPPTDSALRKWAAIAGRTRLASVLRLADARWSAERKSGMIVPAEPRVSSVYRRAIRIAYRDPIEVADLAIDGTDLEQMGITGRAVGRVLRNLLENVINDPAVNTRERLLALAANEK
jgi:tRNA nucleotidyltransferase/poly(A) polymerase